MAETDDDSRLDAKPNPIFVRPRAFGDGVYDILLARIMSLEIGPGERISVDRLARELQVSQTPIREALGRLEALGLVVRIHLAGYRAAPRLTTKQFEDLFDLRLMIEPELARQAASNADETVIESLHATTEGMERVATSLAERTYGEFARFDSRFHDLIALSSGNKLVHDILTRLHIHVHIFRALSDESVAVNAVTEHRQILSAIFRRDPAAAGTAMRRHIESARKGLRSTFGNSGA